MAARKKKRKLDMAQLLALLKTDVTIFHRSHALKLQFYHLLTVKKKSFEPNCFSKNHDTCVSLTYGKPLEERMIFFSRVEEKSSMNHETRQTK